jgi:hypothetical protein
MNNTGSTDPLEFARALEASTLTDMLGHQVTMRKDDHQLISTHDVGVSIMEPTVCPPCHRADMRAIAAREALTRALSEAA